MSDPTPKSANAVLYALSLAGCTQLWGRAMMDGTLDHLYHALHGPRPYKLPGTESFLKQSFTGIYWPVDYLLSVLVIFFWEAVDGSHPDVSAVGLYFLGQYFTVLAVFYLAYCRRGSGSSFIRPTIWLTVFQMIGLGCGGPIWALTYIGSNSTFPRRVTSASLRNMCLIPSHLPHTIICGIIFGYLLPAVVMALPSPFWMSHDTKQVAVVLWNIFPCLVFAIITALEALISQVQHSQVSGPGEPIAFSNQNHLANVRWMFALALGFSFACHVAVCAISISTVCFPGLWEERYIAELSPAKLFVPPMALTVGQTVGDGVRSFMIWDQVVGYTTIEFVMLLQLRNASYATSTTFSWAKSIAGAILGSALLGPGSVIVISSWMHDEVLFRTI